MELQRDLLELYKTVFTCPAIDNHAHAFLKAEHRDVVPFEGLISEANGSALTEDAVHTLACYRATAQLSKLFNLGERAEWEDVKRARKAMEYEALCRICMEPTNIQCILIDDGLGVRDLVYDYKWHDRFTTSPTKRIVRVEVLAEDVLKDIMNERLPKDGIDPHMMTQTFVPKLTSAITASAADSEVAGFKSIACYRTGLDITVNQEWVDLERCFIAIALRYESLKTLRLADKALNDLVFHTGLGDNDISLSRSTPALMQPIIKAYPSTKIILLHSSYPFTQEAGYLTAVYLNVYLDFGEIFPFLSADGQRNVVKQVLELCPTNKIMWSTDGHFWPESYYLGTIQAREVMYQVLEASLRRGELTLSQATGIVKRAFFDNANRIYNLGLEPRSVRVDVDMF